MFLNFFFTFSLQKALFLSTVSITLLIKKITTKYYPFPFENANVRGGERGIGIFHNPKEKLYKDSFLMIHRRSCLKAASHSARLTVFFNKLGS